MTESDLSPIAFGHWFEAETQLIPTLLEDENMILPLSFDSDPFLEGYNLTEKVLELVKTKKLRSVFIGNDYIAGGLIKGLLENGIDIPGDIAVIGFGNYDAAPYFAKSLTSVGASSENTALEMIKAICGDRDPFPENTEINYSIYERESLIFK
jgi:DNA-binding LacI/PurR family transcriptional regulator